MKTWLISCHEIATVSVMIFTPCISRSLLNMRKDYLFQSSAFIPVFFLYIVFMWGFPLLGFLSKFNYSVERGVNSYTNRGELDFSLH